MDGVFKLEKVKPKSNCSFLRRRLSPQIGLPARPCARLSAWKHRKGECGFTCRSVAFGLPEPTFEVVMRLRQAPLSVPARLWGGSSLSLPVAHRQPDRLTLWYLKLVC